MSSPIVIVEFGVEGGGETIYGRQHEGAWLFWSEGSAGGILDDELDDDPVVHWKREERADLASLLPDWFAFAYPLLLNPDFADQLIALWRQACAKREGMAPDMESSWWRAVERWHEAEARALASKG